MSCVVEGCKSHSSRKEKDNESCTFHRFPNDDEMKIKWIRCINRPRWTPKKFSRICSKHFIKDSFVPNDNYKWRRLKSDAVPMLNLPEETSSFVMTNLPLTEKSLQNFAEPNTSCQYQSIAEPLTKINKGNTLINLKREISSINCGTSTDEEKIETSNEKKIRLLEKQVEKLKKISKRRLRRINTLTKRNTRLSKKNADLYTILQNKLSLENTETKDINMLDSINKN